MTPLLAAEAGEHAASFPLLTSIIVLPAAGALAVALISKRRPDTVRQVAALFAIVTGAITVWLMANFDRGSDGFQWVENKRWVADLGIGWHLGIDGISLFLVVLTGFLFPLAILAIKPEHDDKPYYAWLLLLEAGCMGVFVVLDLFAFFVFFEIVLVPMYFLIGGWGHGNKTYAALKFFIYTTFGSAVMLVGIIATAVLSARATGQGLTFDLVQLAETQAIAATTARWLFLAFALAFAIKVPLFPLHTWLPDAHTEAPTAGSVILAGVMLKLGTYGFVRFGLYLFPEASHFFAPLMLTLATVGIVYGAVVATMQHDLKRLVAYSSVAHLGFIILGVFALNSQALTGAVLQMVNHGLSTGALFLLVGMIYERRHTREISQLSGLQKSAPIMAAAFTLVMMSSIGLPGLNGFVGEFLILLGTFASHRWWAVVSATGVILASLYLLWGYQRVFHGTPQGEENENFKDMNPRETLAIVALVIPIVFLGVYPKPVIERLEPSIDRLLAHVEDNVDGFHPADTPEPERRSAEDLSKVAADASHEEGGHEGGGAGDGEHEEGEQQGATDDAGHEGGAGE